MTKLTDNKKLIIIGLVLMGAIIFAGSIQASGRYQPPKGGQGSEQTQNTYNASINANSSGSEAHSGASAVSGSRSSSGGNILHASGGRLDSRATAAGGDAHATGGVGVGGKVGDTTASSGGNTQGVDVEGDTDNSQTTITYEGDEHAASSAASVFAGVCQIGASGQSKSGGFAVIGGDPVCDRVRLARVNWDAHRLAVTRMAECQCVGICTEKLASVEQVCTAEQDERAQYYLAQYHSHLKAANDMTESTSVFSWIGRALTQGAGILVGLAAVVL